MQQLLTPRLVLRGFRPSDVDAVHAYASDPEVARYTDWGPNTRAETEAHLVESSGEDGSKGTYSWAIVRRADASGVADGLGVTDDGSGVTDEHRAGEVIGSGSLWITSERDRRAMFGYVLARPVWRRGYATEAARAMLGFAFGTLDLHRMEATCRPDNLGSIGVLRNIGMRQQGHLTEHILIRGSWQDSLLFGVIAGQASLSLDS